MPEKTATISFYDPDGNRYVTVFLETFVRPKDLGVYIGKLIQTDNHTEYVLSKLLARGDVTICSAEAAADYRYEIHEDKGWTIARLKIVAPSNHIYDGKPVALFEDWLTPDWILKDW